MSLPDSKLAKLEEYAKENKDKWTLRSPCTWHAVEAWNSVGAQPQLTNRHAVRGSQLYRQIKRLGGKKIGWGKRGAYDGALSGIDL